MHDWIPCLLLILAGFVAGVVNTIAGGGSFLTLPALMYLWGLEPKIANGTNRVAILLSTFSATATFHKHGRIDRRLALRLALPTLAGVPCGALLAVYLPAAAFKPLFGAIFLGMAVLLVRNPKLLAERDTPLVSSPGGEIACFFAIGVYIGFIQAGMGILLLLGMGLFHGRDLVAANAVKNVLGLAVTVTGLAVFVFYGQIAWLPGLVMAVGNLAGGFVGARLAIRKGRQLILGGLIVVMLLTATQLLWGSLFGSKAASPDVPKALAVPTAGR